jgi:hypothetical protein
MITVLKFTGQLQEKSRKGMEIFHILRRFEGMLIGQL